METVPSAPVPAATLVTILGGLVSFLVTPVPPVGGLVLICRYNAGALFGSSHNVRCACIV